MSARLEERRAENQRLIAELEARVAQKTREVLRADRLATLGGIAAGFAHEIGNSLNVIRGYAVGGVARAARRLAGEGRRRGDPARGRRGPPRSSSASSSSPAPARSTRTRSRSSRSCARRRRWSGPPRRRRRSSGRSSSRRGSRTCVADAELLRQAFLNLCVNAIQAMQERGGGRLAVRARRDGDGVVVEVSDTGPRASTPRRAPTSSSRSSRPRRTGPASGSPSSGRRPRPTAAAVEVESAPGGGRDLPGPAARRRRREAEARSAAGGSA